MSKMRASANVWAFIRKYSAAILLGLMLIINAIITPNFFDFGTLSNIIIQTSVIIFTGMGMTMVISTGGIDISVGAVMALSGVVAAMFVGYGVLPAMIAALLASMCSGVIAGFMIGTLKVQPMVTTLGLMIGIRGVAQVLNNGQIFFIEGNHAEAFMSIGAYRMFDRIPVQVIPSVLVIVAVWFLLEKTRLGRYIQAVGDNPKSAYLAGISSSRTLMFVYVISALCAGMAGILATARFEAADPNTLGLLSELDAIAAVAVGGTAMSGGRAKVFGTVIGALIMQLITITVVMNNVPFEYAQIFKALIIILAVYIQKDKK